MKKDDGLIIYRSSDGEIEIKTHLQDESIWLSQKQISKVFDKDVRTINEHIKNIIKEGELDQNSVIRKIRITAEDGKSYYTNIYNLDMILSVGYRVNSRKATDFRIWATKILKHYLVKGFVVNDKRFLEAQKIIKFITDKSKTKELSGKEKEILYVISQYTKTWKVLGEYDEGIFEIKRQKKAEFTLSYYRCNEIIDNLKEDLIAKKIVGELFGLERDCQLKGIIGNLYQTFGRSELYKSVEEKAAHLLYFVIKDHPFSDGNKRIGSLLFLYFLEKNNFLFKENGDTKITDRTLVALALLVACSDPKEKETIIKLIINLTQE